MLAKTTVDSYYRRDGIKLRNVGETELQQLHRDVRKIKHIEGRAVAVECRPSTQESWTVVTTP